MQAWKDVLLWWINADYYNVAMYIPSEQILSSETGPLIVQRLANTLSESGFEVAPKEDIPCIWSKVATKELERRKGLQKYTAGYTPEQKQYMLGELTDLIQALSNSSKNQELVSILEVYRNEVEFQTKIDTPWRDV